MFRTRALRSISVREGERVSKELQGRSITFLRHKGQVHAFDSNCYHMGGPLAEGDIEELAGGHLCITCPWHKYKINLETGGHLDTDLAGQMCSSAPKQRIYDVIDDTEYLWIELDIKEPRDSDKYNGSLLESPMQSGKSSQSSGYGLGSSAFSQFGGLNGLESRGLGTSYSPARSSFSEEVLGSQESTSSTAFLEPFGGADNVKFYPPPSPLKSQQPAHDGRLAMRGRKGPNMRGAAARAAVLKNYRPPPSSVGTPGVQRTITEMFSRVPQALPPALSPAVHTGSQDMDVDL